MFKLFLLGALVVVFSSPSLAAVADVPSELNLQEIVAEVSRHQHGDHNMKEFACAIYEKAIEKYQPIIDRIKERMVGVIGLAREQINDQLQVKLEKMEKLQARHDEKCE